MIEFILDIIIASLYHLQMNRIDIESQEVMTTISMDTEIYGMAVSGETIYYCTGDNGLKILNLSERYVSDIISCYMAGVYHIATSGDKLYYTNSNTHAVKCCDLHGTTQWEFNDKRVLQSPSGISVDNDGNVYVVGRRSNNVVVISPHGQRHRQLLSSKNGLVNPRLLEYNKSTNRLLVVNVNESAFLFDVTVGQQRKSRTLCTILVNYLYFNTTSQTFSYHLSFYNNVYSCSTFLMWYLY